jgi:hypothetical protein
MRLPNSPSSSSYVAPSSPASPPNPISPSHLDPEERENAEREDLAKKKAEKRAEQRVEQEQKKASKQQEQADRKAKVLEIANKNFDFIWDKLRIRDYMNGSYQLTPSQAKFCSILRRVQFALRHDLLGLAMTYLREIVLFVAEEQYESCKLRNSNLDNYSWKIKVLTKHFKTGRCQQIPCGLSAQFSEQLKKVKDLGNKSAHASKSPKM